MSATISCDYSKSDQAYHENLSYEMANATGMALSIDNPGLVGSFGTYGWHGTIEIPSLGCYSVNGPQTYTLYTVGGTGPQASVTIVRTGTYTAITPPPFSLPTPQTSPLPTPAAAPMTAPTFTPPLAATLVLTDAPTLAPVPPLLLPAVPLTLDPATVKTTSSATTSAPGH